MKLTPLTETFATTRDNLQRVATHVLARRRYDLCGKFGLRATPGGIGTPASGPDHEIVRIAGTVLIRERAGADARTTSLDLTRATLAEAAALVSVDLTTSFEAAGDTPPTGDATAPLDIDPDAAAVLADWYRFSWAALDTTLAALEPDAEPSVVQLWPEHFDAGCDVAAAPGQRVNLGASPGDGFCSHPYIYVGPWNADRPGDPSFWNAPFGAVLTHDELRASADPIATARARFCCVASHSSLYECCLDRPPMRGDEERLRVSVFGPALLKDPVLNKGTAFSLRERHELALDGLLPPAIETIDQQVARVGLEYATKRTSLGRHIYLRQLQDESRVLFYRFVVDHLEEVLPVVYTPTVGEACQRFSRIYRRPHGLFVSYPDVDHLDEMLENAAPAGLRVIVVTDGERILGLGDQGVGGMGIPIGKLALYTACGGIHPSSSLPVFLDVGTNNPELLADPMYLGWRHERIDQSSYDRFVDAFVDAVGRRFPRALLQWEDFAQHNATRLLARHREQICSFNDDIQGTAAVALATVIGGARATGTRLVDQRVVIAGAGSAGSGIGEALVCAMVADGLSDSAARQHVFLVDRDGLIHEGLPTLTSFQQPLAQPDEAIDRWRRSPHTEIPLLEVVANVHPTVLIGVSGQPGLFDDEVLRVMAAGVARPIVLPMSNPTSRAEATPAAITRVVGDRALVATGSPFEGVAQANNVYVFPGVGLGVLASEASRVTDAMMVAAAHAIAAAAPTNALLPPLRSIRSVSRAVALAVAKTAVADGAAPAASDTELDARIGSLVWDPHYQPVDYGEPNDLTASSASGVA